MNFGLNYDGTYIEYKSINHKANLKDIQYLLIDNTTLLKGKTYTIIDVNQIKSQNEGLIPDLIEIDFDISYVPIDTPCCDASTIHSTVPLTTIEKIYSIYPLIKQLFDFNIYKNAFYTAQDSLNIDSIVIKTKNKEISFDQYDTDKKIFKTFKKLNISTNVKDILGENKHLILKKGKWYISEIIPKHFDYIGYNLSKIETVYLLTENQYDRFISIKRLTIGIYDRTDYSSLYEFDEFVIDPTDYQDVDYIEDAELKFILESCIYFPQLIELEKEVYKKLIAISIVLETDRLNYTLNISEEETKESGLCLFKILNKLLQM